MAGQLERDVVFGALTRPQMFAGVTYSFFVINAATTAELFLITKSPWSFVAAGALHVAAYAACMNEPRIFDLWLTRVRHCTRVRNWRVWRCNSYCP